MPAVGALHGLNEMLMPLVIGGRGIPAARRHRRP